MSYASRVDDALDLMVAVDPTLISFDRHDIAGWLRVTPERASTMLALHRDAQTRGRTRHIAVSRGYARAARWFLLSAHGLPGERLTLGHAAYVAADLHRRAESDISAELSPAMMRHPAVQLAVQAMGNHIEQAVNDGVNMINLALSLVAATTGTVPNLTLVP